MNRELTPILIIVTFVVYPFAVSGVGALLISRNGRQRFAFPAAKLFALVGCIPPLGLVATYGFGKLPPVTLLGSAIFVFGATATGLLFGAILDLLIPPSVAAPQRSEEAIDDDGIENPYRAPRST